MTLSSWDDYPVHQAAEFVRHPATTDKNFYDRYYFNCHPCSDDWFAVFGMGQYPNLGVTDAFVDIRRGDRQHVVRASKPLGDRRDLSVGPFRVEVIEPLEKLRFVVEPGACDDQSVAMDLLWEGHCPAVPEPRQFIRIKEKVIFDTCRLVQTGRWSGTIAIGGDEMAITPERCWGNRDRSWGVRPVGEPEVGGIRETDLVLPGMWNYYPMQFDDHAIFYICNETFDGGRPLVQAERVWSARASDGSIRIDHLGRAEHEHVVEPGTRVIESSVITFPDVGMEVECRSLLPNFISVGTGYGIDADWKQGMYKGPETVVESLVLDVAEIRPIAQYGIIDHVASYAYGDQSGFGLLEQGFFGPFPRYGMTDGLMGAPTPK